MIVIIKRGQKTSITSRFLPIIYVNVSGALGIRWRKYITRVIWRFVFMLGSALKKNIVGAQFRRSIFALASFRSSSDIHQMVRSPAYIFKRSLQLQLQRKLDSRGAWEATVGVPGATATRIFVPHTWRFSRGAPCFRLTRSTERLGTEWFIWKKWLCI